jgi:glucose/arabinose dehydrogenase
LLGITHDPNFASNHFVYLYHTVPGSNTQAFNEVTRYTLSGDTLLPESAVDILKLNSLSAATNHNAGAMHFGLDGLLYIATGEIGNPPNAQSINNLMGKILRIDVSQITPLDPVNDLAKLIPPSNPFNPLTLLNINDAIYALGFRNPFNFAVNPATGAILVDDVGQSSFEEIDLLQPGKNYGWPNEEGFANPATSPFIAGPGVYQDPVLAYPHSGGPAGGGSAIVGAAFYVPPDGAAKPFPASFDGKFFYADFGGNWIRYFDPAHPGTFANPDTSMAFATQTAANPTGLAIGPDGSLLYISTANGGELLKIAAPDPNAPVFTLQPTNQKAAVGHAATFTALATAPVAFGYQWQRNNGPHHSFIDIPGETGASLTLPAVTEADKSANFRVVASNGLGSTISTIVALKVTANHAPSPKIQVTGLQSGKFNAGSPITFTVSATDAEDGAEPASNLTWRVDYLTGLNSTTVVHSVLPATTGQASGVFTPSATDAYKFVDVLYHITLTATDADGVSKTVTRDVRPHVVAIKLRTDPKGLPLSFDGAQQTTPFSTKSIAGFVRSLGIVATPGFTFSQWSDGGAASHDVAPLRDTTYTASFVAG